MDGVSVVAALSYQKLPPVRRGDLRGVTNPERATHRTEKHEPEVRHGGGRSDARGPADEPPRDLLWDPADQRREKQRQSDGPDRIATTRDHEAMGCPEIQI